MGKRSSFERIPRDFYPTPHAAVPPLIPHLRGVRTFAEPCCGDGALVRHLESLRAALRLCGRHRDRPGRVGARRGWRRRRDHHQPALHAQAHACADRALRRICQPGCCSIRTGRGPSRPRRSCRLAPTSCRSAACAGSKERNSGKDNFAWYRFDARHLAGPIFHPLRSALVSSQASLCAQCGKPYRPQRSDSRFCSDACRQRAYRERS